MEIILRDITELKGYDKNARKHSKEQIQIICDSIEKFGFNDPIEIDENLTILSGHARVAAAKKLKLKQVPTIIHSHMTDDEKKAYILAANQIALKSEWDIDILKEEITDLHLNQFDLSVAGFSEDEILALILDEEETEGLTLDDEVPAQQEEPITKLGDVWLLGDHRLMCGSSTNITDVDKLFAGSKPNLMVTDPPYGVKYEASWRADAKGRKKTEREETSNLMNDDQADWYDAYVLFTGAVAYVWHASAFTDVVMDGLRRAGFEIKQQIIWNKNVHALSRSDYHWKHEPCWYAVKKDGDRTWQGDRKQMTVWDVKSVQSEKDKTSHPTQKPVEIYTKSILNHTKLYEHVYDPFSGSGTLIIACEKSHRKALSMELDPKFCDVIIKRWQNFTGLKAKLEATGEEYNG